MEKLFHEQIFNVTPLYSVQQSQTGTGCFCKQSFSTFAYSSFIETSTQDKAESYSPIFWTSHRKMFFTNFFSGYSKKFTLLATHWINVIERSLVIWTFMSSKRVISEFAQNGEKKIVQIWISIFLNLIPNNSVVVFVCFNCSSF